MILKLLNLFKILLYTLNYFRFIDFELTNLQINFFTLFRTPEIIFLLLIQISSVWFLFFLNV